MTRALACAALLAASSCAHAGIRLSDAEAEAVGRKIWHNESRGSVDGLTHWNKGENFASLGIGHFIWYKAGERGPFTESFPGLLDALSAAGRPPRVGPAQDPRRRAGPRAPGIAVPLRPRRRDAQRRVRADGLRELQGRGRQP